MSSSWYDLKAAFRKFMLNLKEGKVATDSWNAFCVIAKNLTPPNHLKYIIQHSLNSKNDYILDHGCGGALNVCYLLGNEFKNVQGIDIFCPNNDFDLINSFLISNNIIESEILFYYDGKVSPFNDEKFDVIFSTQVIEHLPDEDFKYFFKEERRILSSSGVLFHEFPHKHTIYEGHLNTYIIHMLPNFILIRLMKILKNSRYARINRDLFLRSMVKIKKSIKVYFGSVEDLTKDRLRLETDYEQYKGNVKLRKLIHRIVSIGMMRSILATFAIKTIKVH